MGEPDSSKTLFITKQVSGATTADRLIVRNFVDGMLGITLTNGSVEAPSEPQDRVIVGDYSPVDIEPETPGIQYQSDDLGNPVLNMNSPAPDQVDVLVDGSGDDLIQSGGGDDKINALRGGNDQIEAGSGDDIVYAGFGNDTVFGGSGDDELYGQDGDDVITGGLGTDVLVGGKGEDTLYVDDEKEFEEVNTQAESSGKRGSFLDGGDGNDKLVGGLNNEVILGGAGDDFVFGGSGDDVVLADQEMAFSIPDPNWSVEVVPGGATSEVIHTLVLHGIYRKDSSKPGNDIVFAGAGSDHVYAGLGNDVVDGGDGDDFLIGQGGDDTLWGGRGNDHLWGDIWDSQDQGADYLNGGEGDDYLQGHYGDDVLVGSTGKDRLLGNEGNDTLYGGAGSDELDGNEGDDLLDGEDDDDRLFAGEGNDTLYGGAGSDELDGNEGDDLLDGEDGDDRLFGGVGNDALFGGAGADTLHGYSGDDFLSGDEGNDILVGGDGDDVLDGGEGVDELHGGLGFDRYLNVGPEDFMSDADGKFEIHFANGVRAQDVEVVKAYIDGVPMWSLFIGDKNIFQFGAESETNGNSYNLADGTHFIQEDFFGKKLKQTVYLAGSENDDILHGYALGDGLYGSGGNDSLFGYLGDDQLSGGADDDILVGGEGNDSLSGGEGNDTYVFAKGDGHDVISNEGDSFDMDVVRLTNGIDRAAVEFLRVANGDLLISVNDGSDSITIKGWYQNSENRIGRIEFDNGDVVLSADLDELQVPPIEGTSGADSLFGTNYSDRIIAREGDDIIDGKGGDDEIWGGEGRDTYILKRGMGRDLVVDTSSAGNLIQLAPGLEIHEVDARRRGDDLYVHIAGTEDGFTLHDFFSNLQGWEIQGKNGSTLSIQDVIDATVAMDESAMESIWRDNLGRMRSATLARSLEYGTLLNGYEFELREDGSYFRSWNDGLFGEVRHKSVQTDRILTYYDHYTGAKGADSTHLKDTTEWDTFNGNLFEEHLFQKNVLTISDEAEIYSAPDEWSQISQIVSAEVEWNENFDWDGLRVSTSQSSQKLYKDGVPIGYYTDIVTTTVQTGRATGNFKEIQPEGFFPISNGPSPRFIEAKSHKDLYTIVVEEIFAGASDNRIYAGANTLVDAGAGRDIVFDAGLAYGGDGNDIIVNALYESESIAYGGQGDDVLLHGSILVGGAGHDYMRSTSTIKGDDQKNTGTRFQIDPHQFGYDVVDDEYIFSGEVFPYYIFEKLGIEERPRANDYLGIKPLIEAGYLGQDVLEFGEGLASENVVVTVVDHSHLTLSWGEGKEVLLNVASEYDYYGSGVELVKFYDGTEWTMTDLWKKAKARKGTDGSDVLFSGASNSFVQGEGGDDELYGGEGDDILHGGKGNDFLDGGRGNDIFFFNRGDGIDVIDSRSAEEYLGEDAIRFGSDVSPSEVQISRSRSDIHLRLSGTGDEVILRGAFYESNLYLNIGRIEFADGTVWNREELLGRISVAPSSGDDYLDSTSGDVVLDGLDGDDFLIGSGSNDILTGGAGNDHLDGGGGSDTYVFHAGFGHDTISVNDWGSIDGGDTIEFASGVSPADVTVSVDPYGSLYLITNGGADSVRVDYWNYSDDRLAWVKFDDGTQWDSAALAAMIASAAPTAHGDAIWDSDQGGFIEGGGGDDQIWGDGGNDYLSGGVGNDALDGGFGNDILSGDAGDDELSDWDDSNALHGGDGSDSLSVYDSSFVAGGKGGDALEIGGFNNVIAFNLGDGADKIYATYDNANAPFTLSLGGGALVGDLSLSMDSSSFTLHLGKTDSVTFERENWHSYSYRVLNGEELTRGEITLQVIGSDIRTYDFSAVLEDFEYAQSQGISAKNWSVSAALANHVQSFNTNRAIGGQIAYHYALCGTLDGLDAEVAQAALSDENFGVVTQDIAINPAFLVGGETDDHLIGTTGNDTLSGGAGDDLLSGGAGNDVYLFNLGNGQDNIVETSGIDTIRFGEGITADSLSLGIGSLLVRYGAQGDAIHIEGFNPADAAATPAIEQFVFADGTALSYEQLLARGFDLAGSGAISGTSVTDRIQGGDEDDTIEGGRGNDVLMGGAGHDRYLFKTGDGLDTVHEMEGENRIVFGAGITVSDLHFNHGDGILTIRYSDIDAVTLKGFNLFGNGGTLVASTLEFSDGTTVSLAELVDHAPEVTHPLLPLTVDEDVPFTFQIPEDAFGDADSGDTLSFTATRADGTALPDWLHFDSVTGTFSGMPGNSDIGSLDVDITVTDAFGKKASQVLNLMVNNVNDAPTEVTLSSNTVNENAFDAVIGTLGTSDPDSGNTFTYSIADGTEEFVIEDDTLKVGAAGLDYEAGASRTVTVRSTDQNGLTVDQTLTISVSNVNEAPAVTSAAAVAVAENVATGTVVYTATASDVDAGDTATWSLDGDDADAFTIDAATGEVRLKTAVDYEAKASYSVVVLATDASGLVGSQAVTITVEDGDEASLNVIVGTNDSDTLYGTSIADAINGQQGDDNLQGLEGNDVLTGGLGNDTLSGGEGDDTYVFNLGDGQDAIIEYTDTGMNDVLMLGYGLDAEAVQVLRENADLVLNFNGSDKVRIASYFERVIESIQFADGTVWDVDTVVGKAVQQGTEAADTLIGFWGADNRIEGLAGDDDIVGGDKNDTLAGGTGNDTLTGGYGNDTYVFNAGDGHDTVVEYTGANSGIDTLHFGEGIAANDIQLIRQDMDLVLGVGNDDQVRIASYFSKVVENIEFSDGTVWNYATVSNRLVQRGTNEADSLTGVWNTNNAIEGLDGDDVLNGANRNDFLNGGNGNDQLYSGAGTDILQGAAGADILYDTSGNGLFDGGDGNDTITGGLANEFIAGGAGNDTIITGKGMDILAFNRGHGVDTVNASVGLDNTVSLGNGIQFADLLFKKSANDLVLMTGGGEQVTFKGWYSTAANNHSVAKLQMVLEGGEDYIPGATSSINDNKVEWFNFEGLVSKFDQARAANASLTTWSLASSLLEFHLGGGDVSAIGGDVAYQYATSGNLANLSMVPTQALLADASFGTAAQNLQGPASLQDQTPRLI